MDEKVSDGPAGGTIEVDGVAPRSMVTIGEELWGVKAEIISFRPKVVVDDVQQNHHSADMGGLYQLFEIFRTAVNTIGCELVYAVVSPISTARKIGHRHQLQSCHSEIRQVVQALASRRKSSGWHERAHVKFVDHSLSPSAAMPGIVLPIESVRVAYFTGTVNIPRLKTGSGVRHFLSAINLEPVERSWLCRIGHHFVPTLIHAPKRQRCNFFDIL